MEHSHTIAEGSAKTGDGSRITQTLLQVYAAANRTVQIDNKEVNVAGNAEQTEKASERECLT